VRVCERECVCVCVRVCVCERGSVVWGERVELGGRGITIKKKQTDCVGVRHRYIRHNSD